MTARCSFDPCAGQSCVWGSILNALRVALRINSGKIIFISQFWKICGFSRIAFSREGSWRETAFAAPLSAKARRCGKALLSAKARRCGKALLGASGLNPLRHGLRRATSPERGRFCSTYRKVPKSSPFGGAGRDRRERTERVCSREYPLRLCFANPPPPKGGGFALLTGRSRKAPPFGGAGIERSEMTERVLLSSPCPIKPENDPLKM